MSLHKQLIKAAESMEAKAALLEKAAEVIDKAAAKVAAAEKAKPAAQQKTAAEKVRIGQLAKTASAELLKAGLLSSQEQADVFANAVANSHDAALGQLAKFAGCVPATKLGSVVVDDAPVQSDSADSVYEKTAKQHLQRMNINA